MASFDVEACLFHVPRETFVEIVDLEAFNMIFCDIANYRHVVHASEVGRFFLGRAPALELFF